LESKPAAGDGVSQEIDENQVIVMENHNKSKDLAVYKQQIYSQNSASEEKKGNSEKMERRPEKITVDAEKVANRSEEVAPDKTFLSNRKDEEVLNFTKKINQEQRLRKSRIQSTIHDSKSRVHQEVKKKNFKDGIWILVARRDSNNSVRHVEYRDILQHWLPSQVLGKF
jgi:hypothetical protein